MEPKPKTGVSPGESAARGPALARAADFWHTQMGLRNEVMESLVSPNRPSEDGKAKKQRSGTSTSAHKQLITRNLRMVYDQIAGEEIPPRILDLLQQIDESEKGSRK